MKTALRSSMAMALLLLSNDPLKAAEAGNQPSVGDSAADFQLKSLNGHRVQLSKLSGSPVVLVVLRGYPGYQCPVCNRQVGQFVGQAAAFQQAGAEVVFVYPGPGKGLQNKGEEFLDDRELPDHFTMVFDPDYSFTNKYGLRWEAPKETAYPATFVIDETGTVRYALISKTHKGRSDVTTVLSEVKKLER